MFRKLTIALAATAAIGAAALSPTTASAGWHGYHGWHGHYGHGFRVGFYVPTYLAAPNCYIVKRVVATPYGPKLRRVTVCD